MLPPGTAMALFAMGLGVLVIANDFTALNVALPAIEQDFDVDVGTVQWVINAYALSFGMAIVTGGRLADLFGRRRIFFTGAAIFAGFSLLGGLAQDPGQLIAMRVGMGLGGALMWPAILGMTFAALPAERAPLAGGLILGVAGLGNAVGPLVGGVLTDELSWRWIFFLNLPIAAIAVAVIWAKVHQPVPGSETRRLDYGGIAALSLGLVLLLLAFDQAADWGWGDWRVLAMFALAAVLVLVFSRIEPRAGAAALIPGDVLGNRRFRSAALAVLLMSAVFFAVVVYGPQMMEKLLGYSALKAGVGMLPMLATFGIVAFFSERLYERIGGRPILAVGALCLALGPFLVSLFDAGSSYGTLVPGLLVTGLGTGLFYPSITTVAVTALDPARSSLAGGIVYMCQIAGGAIGLGLTTAIFTTRSEDELAAEAADAGTRLTAHQQAVMHGDLAGTDAAASALARLPSGAAETIERIVRESFAAGTQTSLRVVAGLALAGLVVTVLFVRPGEAEEASAPAPGDDDSPAPADRGATPAGGAG